MHARQEVVHTEIGHQYAEEGDKHIDMYMQRLMHPPDVVVKRSCIDEHGDESPCFLGIPTPVFSPTDICPDGTDEDSYCYQRYGRVEQKLGEGCKL